MAGQGGNDMTDQPSGAPGSGSGMTAALARFIAEQQVPGAALQAARGKLLNGLANMMQGARDRDFLQFQAAVRPHLPEGTVRVPGLSYGTDALSAAGLACVAANILEFDDTHPETLIHPTAPVLGALLPLLSGRDCAMTDVLAALAIGTEVAVRIGLALGPSHYAAGWHISATCGALGAAAAAARLIGLDREQACHTLAIACSLSSGLVINLSSPAKAVGMMRAGRNGLEAALLAEAGLAGAQDALEGRGGFLALTSTAHEPAAGIDGLGTVWRGLETSVKPYPTCAVIHPVLDGLFALRDRIAAGERAVASIEVEGNPLMLVRADRPAPKTALEGKLSLQHSVAAAWLRGSAGVAEFAPEVLQDPELRALAGKVAPSADPAMAQGTARVAVHLASGRTERIEVLHPRGSADRPMSRAEIDDKCRLLLLGANKDFPAEDFIALCWTGRDRADLLRLLDMMEIADD
jgi:2-methylcitrate dehydratase PrpD